jgi:N-acetylglucosamine-6-phosphate deacetylase
MTALVLRGGTVVDRAGRRTADVVLDGGRIVAVAPGAERPVGARVLPAAGLLVAAGYCDLQCNGAHGVDLAREPERLWEMAAVLPRHGVTTWLPTIVTSPPEVAERARRTLLAGRPPDVAPGATPLGLHLEGPMLNPARKGAHPAGLLRAPSPAVYGQWSAAAGVTLVTLAPELPGALDAVRALRAAGVLVAAGHTDASAGELAAAVDAGVRLVTHLFNAMRPFAHRDPGPVGVALADERLAAGLIADGVHVDPVAVAAAWRALGPERTVLVSDAVAALGLSAGPARLGDGTLAGSALALDDAVRNLVAWTGCPVPDAVATVTSTPARVLGRDAGAVAPGQPGDLTVLDADLRAVATIVAGDVVFAGTGSGW